jgi:hypothetical protein
MKTFIRGTVSALLLSAVAITAAPGTASAEWTAKYDAVLYELNENMSLRALRGGHRKATSQLLGFAKAGSPLCPTALAYGKPYCTINATGSDNISLISGLGKFGGTFTVVAEVDGNNPVDSPEAVLAKGRFNGDMDFSLAIVPEMPVPLGSVRGHMALNGGRKQPFTGTFRLPFVMPLQDPACVRQNGPAQCPMAGYTKPMYLVDLANFGVEYVDLYSELAIGFPTVRFEINFE